MSIDVFLSYARKDRDLAENLFVELEKQGLEVWWDFGLLPGDEFAEKILGVIEISTLTVVLWSENSVKSRWVLSEADLADRNGSLFPVTLDGAPIPMPFSRIHAAHLDWDDVAPNIEDLTAQIVEAVKKKSVSKPRNQTTEVEENQAVLARDALRSHAQNEPVEENGVEPSESVRVNQALHDQLENLLSPLQKLHELENLSIIRKEAEIANQRPQTPTRIIMFAVALVGALAGVTTILTYADISPSDILQRVGWNAPYASLESTPSLDSEQSRSVEETLQSLVRPDSCQACPEMVLLNGGSFLMGSAETEESHRTNEGPLHRVTIGRPIYVSAYEITVDQWKVCSSQGPCVERSEHNALLGDHPITYISWEDANIFANWLSEITGQTYRLLSESEWEYATRAGTRTAFSFGETITSNQVNYDARSVFGLGEVGEYVANTTTVGAYPPNDFGLFDMHGNAGEWVMDCWNPSYISKPRSATDTGLPWADGACYRRAVRGGNWAAPPVEVRSASRDFQTRTTRSAQIGFRVAREF